MSAFEQKAPAVMSASQKGRAFIGVQEGYRSRAYPDAVGVLTIGYGHTSMAGAPRVTVGMVISRAQADQILAADLKKYEAQVRAIVKVPLSQPQFDALLSFTYNEGEGNLERLVAATGLNRGAYTAVPAHMLAYDIAGGRVLADLVRRRRAEAAMFQGRYPNLPVLAVVKVASKVVSAVARAVKA
jgi:lysozyme